MVSGEPFLTVRAVQPLVSGLTVLGRVRLNFVGMW